MKVLCDVHISYKLARFFASRGVLAFHVNQLPEKWHTDDRDICRFADENDCILITKDSDFRDSHFVKKTPRKLVRVCLGNISNQRLLSIFDRWFETLQARYAEERFYIELDESSAF